MSCLRRRSVRSAAYGFGEPTLAITPGVAPTKGDAMPVPKAQGRRGIEAPAPEPRAVHPTGQSCDVLSRSSCAADATSLGLPDGFRGGCEAVSQLPVCSGRTGAMRSRSGSGGVLAEQDAAELLEAAGGSLMAGASTGRVVWHAGTGHRCLGSPLSVSASGGRMSSKAGVPTPPRVADTPRVSRPLNPRGGMSRYRLVRSRTGLGRRTESPLQASWCAKRSPFNGACRHRPSAAS